MEAQSAFKMGAYARDFCYFLPGFHSEMAEARTRDCQQTFYHPDKQNKNIFRPLQMRIISSFKWMIPRRVQVTRFVSIVGEVGDWVDIVIVQSLNSITQRPSCRCCRCHLHLISEGDTGHNTGHHRPGHQQVLSGRISLEKKISQVGS